MEENVYVGINNQDEKIEDYIDQHWPGAFYDGEGFTHDGKEWMYDQINVDRMPSAITVYNIYSMDWWNDLTARD